MTLRSFGLNQDIYDKSVGVPPVNGETLFVANTYYSPYIALSSSAGTLWSAWLSPTGSFNYGGGAASGIGITTLLGADAGDYLATWHTGQPGGANRLVGEVFDSTGHALTGVFQLSSETDTAQFGTAVALPAGGFMAVFADSSHTGNQYLFAQHYGGVSDGYTAAVWLQEGFDLAGRVFDSSFSAAGADFLIQPPTGAIVGNQWQPSPVLLHNGTIAVAYSDDHFYSVSPNSTQNAATQIRVQLLSANGTQLSNVLVDLDSSPGYGFANPPAGAWSYSLPAAHPSIFVTAHGFGLLWQANGSGGGDQAHYLNFQLFDNAGNKLGTEVQLRDDLASVNYDAFFRDYSFAGMQLANGHVVVAYSVNLAGGRQVFLQEFNAAGSKLGGAVQASSGGGSHDIGALYADGAGHVVLGLVQPDGHQDLLTFSEGQQASTIIFADGSYSVTTRGITGHAWTTSVAEYTPHGLLFSESFIDQWDHQWQSYALNASVATTKVYDATGTLVQQTILQGDGSKELDSFGITGKAYVATVTFLDSSGHSAWRDTTNTDGSHALKAWQAGMTVTSGAAGTPSTSAAFATPGSMLTSSGAGQEFAFLGAAGHETLKGFVASGAGQDVLAFSQVQFANAAAVLAAAHASGPHDSVIVFDSGDDVTLKGVSMAALAQADFIFV